jgi:hypothetical protein
VCSIASDVKNIVGALMNQEADAACQGEHDSPLLPGGILL